MAQRIESGRAFFKEGAEHMDNNFEINEKSEHRQSNTGSEALDESKKMLSSHDTSKDCEDRISKLPKDIKIIILSFMPFEDAKRTGELSKQWRYLWKHVCSLNFDEIKTMERIRRSINFYELFLLDHEYHKMVNKVVRAMRQCIGHGVLHQDKCSIRLDIGSGKGYHVKVNELVKFALDRNVKILDLDLTDSFVKDYRFSCAYYTLPQSILNHKSFMNSGSSCLRVLRLRAVNVSGEYLEYFLLNCKHLEELSIAASTSLINLRVCGGGRPLRLKKLEIIYCKNLEHLVIDAENLSCFKFLSHCYRSTALDMPLNYVPSLYVPSLTDLCITEDQFVSYLHNASCEIFRVLLSQLRMLTLHVYPKYIHLGQNLSNLKQIPTLSNLKQLCLKVNSFDGFFACPDKYLFYACPFLQVFRLEIFVKSYSRGSAEIRRLFKTSPVLEHLEEISIIGWIGSEWDVKLLAEVVRRTVKLNKVVFDARDPSTLVKYPYEYVSWGNTVDSCGVTRCLDRARIFADFNLSGVNVEFLPLGFQISRNPVLHTYL